jgi:diguanylate cyclase (GGDEF)-like protein
MQLIDMNEILLLLAQAFLSFALCMGAFRTRHVFGMAPLFFTLGSLEGMKYFAFAQLQISLPWLGVVSPGSLVFYVGSLAVMLVVYAREGLMHARQLLWAMLYVMIVLAVITTLAYQTLLLPTAKQLMAFDPKILSMSAWWQIVGTVMSFIGGLFAIMLYNILGRFTLPVGVRIALSLAVVVAIDSIFFDVLARGINTLGTAAFYSNMAGKVIMAFVYGTFAWLYLRYVDSMDDSVRSNTGTTGKLFAALTYQTRIEALERELQRDALTGAFNRRLDQLRGQPTALLYIDIDHFKKINDQYGHPMGDMILQQLVQLIQSLVRRGDSVIRVGGEEFVVIMPGTTKKEAREFADRMLQHLQSHPLLQQPQTIQATATIGLAVSPQDADSARGLLKCADERLYQGKHAGRASVVG